MVALPFLLGAVAAVATGLDRTAALQMMICRPLVAAPLTGLLLGDVRVGLTVGVFLELLWLSRLPVGASIPHDDTQIAVGATTLAIALAQDLPTVGHGLTILCILVAMPLGKCGQLIERHARHRNSRLQLRAGEAIAAGQMARIERIHLTGLLHFSAAALASYTLIVVAGGLLVHLLAPVFLELIGATAGWLRLAVVLVGIAALLRTMNVKRAYRLFGLGFLVVLLILGWCR